MQGPRIVIDTAGATQLAKIWLTMYVDNTRIADPPGVANIADILIAPVTGLSWSGLRVTLNSEYVFHLNDISR